MLMHRFPSGWLATAALPILVCLMGPVRELAAQTSASVPKGELTKHSFERSKIFPGTVRDYWVYVPRQYDPARPACLHVNQDGVQFDAPAVFDQLIQNKEMPPVIGVQPS